MTNTKRFLLAAAIALFMSGCHTVPAPAAEQAPASAAERGSRESEAPSLSETVPESSENETEKSEPDWVEYDPDIHGPQNHADRPEPATREEADEQARYVMDGGEFIDTVPEAREHYDIQRIIDSGQHDIHWATVKITQNPHDDGQLREGPTREQRPDSKYWSFHYEYPVFDTLPNREFTETVNNLIRDLVCYSYDHYERDGPRNETGMYVTGNRATVEFASPELVSILVFRPFLRDAVVYRLYFNPTTGERYRLHHFLDVSPQFYNDAIQSYDQYHDVTELYWQTALAFLDEYGLEEAARICQDKHNNPLLQPYFDEYEIFAFRSFVLGYQQFYEQIDTTGNPESQPFQTLFEIDGHGKLIGLGFTAPSSYNFGNGFVVPLSVLEPYVYRDE